jgi:hypothetical protein
MMFHQIALVFVVGWHLLALIGLSSSQHWLFVPISLTLAVLSLTVAGIRHQTLPANDEEGSSVFLDVNDKSHGYPPPPVLPAHKLVAFALIAYGMCAFFVSAHDFEDMGGGEASFSISPAGGTGMCIAVATVAWLVGS